MLFDLVMLLQIYLPDTYMRRLMAAVLGLNAPQGTPTKHNHKQLLQELR